MDSSVLVVPLFSVGVAVSKGVYDFARDLASRDVIQLHLRQTSKVSSFPIENHRTEGKSSPLRRSRVASASPLLEVGYGKVSERASLDLKPCSLARSLHRSPVSPFRRTCARALAGCPACPCLPASSVCGWHGLTLTHPLARPPSFLPRLPVCRVCLLVRRSPLARPPRLPGESPEPLARSPPRPPRPSPAWCA